MKTYEVYFTEPVEIRYQKTRWNSENRELETVEVVEMSDYARFTSLVPAKKLIKANINKYKGSCITKIWATGDWENLGEINFKGSNKTFIANTKQRIANY